MTKKLAPVLASALLASTSLAYFFLPGFVPTSLTSGTQLSQVAEAAEPIHIEPRQDYYKRGEMVKVIADFRPNVKVVFSERYKDEHSGQIVEKILSEVTSNAEGIALLPYKVPLEQNKDNVYVIAKGPNRTREIRLPIGGSTPKPQPQPPKPTVNFPILKSSPETKVGSKDYMQTDINLSLNSSGGLLYGKTRTWTTDKWTGFTGGVEVVLLDENENILYISQLRKYGVNGKYIPGSPSSRTSTWNESVPTDVMQRAKKIAIVHRHTPTPRLGNLFGDIKKLVDFIKPLITILGGSSSPS
jgi:hypothetical protein